MHIWSLISIQDFYVAIEPKTKGNVISHQVYLSHPFLALKTNQISS